MPNSFGFLCLIVFNIQRGFSAAIFVGCSLKWTAFLSFPNIVKGRLKTWINRYEVEDSFVSLTGDDNKFSSCARVLLTSCHPAIKTKPYLVTNTPPNCVAVRASIWLVSRCFEFYYGAQANYLARRPSCWWVELRSGGGRVCGQLFFCHQKCFRQSWQNLMFGI